MYYYHADKEDHFLNLVNEHGEGDHDAWGYGSANLEKAFNGCNEVQVCYI